MEKTYMKYMKQGSGTDYEMKKGPDKTKKAPTPGWIDYINLDEGYPESPHGSLMQRTKAGAKAAGVKLAPSQKQLIKIAKAEATVIGNQVRSLQQDISNGDIQGIRSSAGTIQFSIERILNAIH